MITMNEFAAALDRHGADLSRWPPGLAADARALSAGDLMAAKLLAEARDLAGLLGTAMRPAPVDAPLAGRIAAAAIAPREPPGVELHSTRRLAAFAAVALVLALGLGFAAGYFTPPDDEEEAVASLVFGGDDQDIGDRL